MSYGGRRYGGRDYGPSPWDSGSAPDRGYGDRRYGGGDVASQLAAANVIIDALLTGKDRGLKRRYDERDSYSYNRRPLSSSFRRGTQRRGTFNRGRGSGSSRGGKSQKTEDKDKASSGKKEKKEGEEKDENAEKDGEDAEKSETDEKKEGDEEKTDEQTSKPYDKDWKFRCHLCRQSHETEKEHLEHLKTEAHEKMMSEQKARYKRQTQAIVHKLRAIEDMDERSGRGRYGFCTLCNVGFYGNIARHNFSRLHKDMRNLKAAFCRYCNVRFIERINFDEHILTIKHMKLRSKMIKDGDEINKGGLEETLDDDDEEMEDLDYPEEYNGEEALGQQCVRKVIGYFCKICCKFFTEELSDVDTHCKDEEHFKKFVEHAKVRKEEIAKKKEELAKKKEEEDENAVKVEENGLDEATGDVTMEDAEDDEEAVDEKELMGDEENGAEDDEEKVEEEEEKEVDEEKEVEEDKEESPEPEVSTPTRGRGKGRGRGRGRRSTSK